MSPSDESTGFATDLPGGVVPRYRVTSFRHRATRYALCVPVLNEGGRIQRQLVTMRAYASTVDVLIADGGSTDGSVDLELCDRCGVRAVVRLEDEPGLSTQLRMGFAYALYEGYEGVITVDGNEKDDLSALPRFLDALDDGIDFIQGSRFLAGGEAVNTPWRRLVGIRWVHAPVVSRLAGTHYTDTTNGFRAHSRRFLLDPRVALFRDVFRRYEIIPYIAVKAAKLGFWVGEVPVRRVYPSGRTPTHMTRFRGESELLFGLWRLARGAYDP